MKRILVLVFVIISLFAASLALLPYLVSSEGIKQRLSERMVELTGSAISYKGQPKLSLSPFLQVELHDFMLLEENSDQPDLLHVERMKFSLKLLPLMFGKIRLSEFKMIRPKFNLALDEEAHLNWANASRSNKSTSSANNDVTDIDLGRLEIIDGILELSYPGSSDIGKISNFNAYVDWPTFSSSWEVSGDGVWRGEAFKFYNETDEPKALFSSNQSGVRFNLESAVINATFDGIVNTVSGIQLKGQSKLETPTLARFIDLFANTKDIKKPPIGSFSIEGTMSANTGEIGFDQASMKLDENLAVGNLQLFWDQENRTKATGTLAFSTLDVTPLIETLSGNSRRIVTTEENLNAQQIIDLDIRFSAQNYMIGESEFGSLAATAIINEGEWNFDIGEAEFFGGMLIGSISSKTINDEEEIEIKGIFQDVAMGDISRNFFPGDIVAVGKANIDINLKAKGKQVTNDFRNFSGNMDFKLSEGQIDGLDLIKAIPALNKNDGFVTIDQIKGKTPFQTLAFNMLIYNGIGWITDGKAESVSQKYQLSGKTDLIRGGLAIYTDIRGNDASDGTSPQTRIFIGGTARNPLVTRPPLSKIPVIGDHESDG